MTKRTRSKAHFPRSCGRQVEAAFDGGHITSDAGVMLLRSADRKTGLLASVTRRITDPRRAKSCDHTFRSMLAQRVYAVAQGYEDLNDHETLRYDLGLQTAVGRDVRLAHPTTLGRVENMATEEWVEAVEEVLLEHFIRAHDEPPDEIILDFDNTDDRVHGNQEGRFFHGYYGGYCFLPLYVFCGGFLLHARLQRANEDGAKYAQPVLERLVAGIRAAWPNTNIVLRGDGGFCRWRLLRWCDQNFVGYVVGLAKNARLVKMVEAEMEAVAADAAESGEATRRFAELTYSAKTWDRERRVIAKVEHLRLGPNPRFIVTNLGGDPKALYESDYCARGDMENRIKEQQLDLLADRTSCHAWSTNQWRLSLSALAYTLLATIRRVGLANTAMDTARCATIRLKLLKIGAVLIRNTRRVRFLMSSACPNQRLFFHVAERLSG